jgi:hypothetical protein
LHVAVKENISTFHISVEDFSFMEGFEASDDLDEDVPDFLFFDVSFALLIAADFLEDVSVVSILHYEAGFN